MALPLPYVNDQWTLELRELGFESVAMQLAKMVLHSHPPFAACVAGRWGSGKTSVMRYAMTLLGGRPAMVRIPLGISELKDVAYAGVDLIDGIRLAGEDVYRRETSLMPLARIGDKDWPETGAEGLGRVATLWFSPWRFQNDPSPMVPLLHTLRDQLSTWAHTKDQLNRGARVAIEAGLELLGRLADAATTVGVAASADLGKIAEQVRRASDRVDAARLSGPTDTERFSLLFEAAIRSILGASDRENVIAPDDTSHRLVIFVDDLDRCEGAVSLRLLEAIKLYLSTRYCVFVFGLDVTAVESAIAGLWPARNRGLPREYLDKLFQAYVHMPVSSRYAVLVHNRLANWQMLGETGPLEPQAKVDQAHPIARKIADMLPANPRKVKNFLNALRVSWTIAKVGDGRDLDAHELERFALVQRLRAHAPPTFRLIAQNPGDFLPELQDFFDSCNTKRKVERGDNADRVAVMLSDFGHIAVAHRSWESAPANPALSMDELHVRLDSIAADRAFARAWTASGMSKDDFCRYAGLTVAV